MNGMYRHPGGLLVGTLLVTCLLVLGSSFSGEAYTVLVTETDRGEYEDGKFARGSGEFKYRFEVDERAKKAKLTETVRMKGNVVMNTPVDYIITATEDGSSLASFLVSGERRNQKIMTLVGKPGTLATEVILLGEDFFEYCKASAGRFYLATGRVQKSISRAEDFENQAKK